MGMSKRDLVRELHKCGKDPKYFIRHYCKIATREQGLVTFKLWDFQEDLLDDFLNNKRIIINKSRQLGISTLSAAYCAWLMLFYREKNIMIIATKFDVAGNLVKKVRQIFKYLPNFFSQLATVTTDNRTSFVLSNGSTIKASPTSVDAGRSEALSLLVIDEAAHIPEFQEIWTALRPTIEGSRCIALSCVPKDTYVFTEKGIQQVEDFIGQEQDGGYFVEPYKVFGKDKLRQGNLFLNNGIGKTKKIITRFAELEGSLEHKLWVYSDGKFGWKKMGELQKGDFVSIQKGMDVWGNKDEVCFVPEITTNHKNVFHCEKITPELSYVLGMFLAEGNSYISRNSEDKAIGYNISFTCGDKIKNKLEKIGFHIYHDNELRYTISSKTFGKFLEHLGFDLSLKAPQKTIPKRLLQISKENIISLLQGLFDGDSWSRKDRGTIGIGLSSLEMIKQIRILLLNFGILSTISTYETKPTKKVKVSSIQHRLELDRQNSKLFYELIGFSFERKQINERVLKGNENNSYDVLPNGASLAKELFSYYEKGMWSLSKYHNIQLNGLISGHHKNISRKTLLRLFEVVKDKLPESYKIEIQKVLCEDIVWIPIEKIEDDEKEVYDFSLPHNKQDFWAHSVVYNGILGHQSPNGQGNWFHKTFVGAQDGKNDFHPVELMWNVHPDRDEAWFEKEKNSGAWSARDFAQEYLCFDEDTRIYTQYGLKKLKYVSVGDLVLTHKGRWKPIKEKQSRLADVVEVQTYLNKSKTYITPEHPVLLENEKWECFESVDDKFICSVPKNICISEENKFFDLTTIKPDFFSIKETNDGMCFINDRKHKTLHRKIIEIDYDFGYFVGLFLAEGSYNKNQAINFAFNYSTELFTWVSKLQKITKDKFGLENTSIYHNENTGTLQINSALLKKMVQLFAEGKKAPEKHLSTFAYENASKDFLRGVVDGVFRGDGCLLEPYNKKLNITSKELIYDCKFILSILGYGYVSIVSPKKSKNEIMGRKVSCKTSYSINCLATRNKKIEEISDLCECEFHREHSNWKNKVNENERFFLDKVFSKQDHYEKKKVVNISVEGDESYITEHFVVHNCSFNASGETVVDAEDVERIFNSIREPKYKTGPDRNLWIWKKADPDKDYMMICDVSRGDGEDYSSIQLLDIETFEQVLEYKGKMPPDTFAPFVADVGEEYNNALVIIEYNTLGFTVASKLLDLGYPNVAYFQKGTYDFIEKHAVPGRNDALPGFTMSVKSRPLVIAKWEEFVRNKKLSIISQRTYDEITTFIWKNGKPQAAKGYHDDLIMPLAIGCWVYDLVYQKSSRNTAYKRAALNAISVKRKNFKEINPIYKRPNELTPGQREAKVLHKKFAWIYR